MLASGFIINENNEILMVRQYVTGGELAWTMPGGTVEEGETYSEACVREVFEETGYEVETKRILLDNWNRVVYLCEIVGGSMGIDRTLSDNDEILDVDWLCMSGEFWDDYSLPVLERFEEGLYGRVGM